MNSKLVLLTALAAALVPVGALAQAAPASPQPDAPQPATAASAPAASVAPQAYPAKIALIQFQQAVIATNEGQVALAAVRKKYEPKQTQLEALNTEIDALKKQLQAAGSSTEAEKAARLKTIDTKQKQLDKDTDDARTSYQADLQDAYGKVADKVHSLILDYVKDNGYTLLFDVGSEQSPIIWAAPNPSADITEAVVKAYNVASGVAPPPPDAPAAASAAPAAASRPKAATTTTPHAAAKTPAH